MKKKIKSTLAFMLALTMVIGSSMTVFAYDDGVVHHGNEGNGESAEGEGAGIPGNSGGGSSSSSNSGSSSSSESSGGSSYSSGSGSYDAGSGDSGSTGSYSAPAPKAAGTAATAGKESFKALAKPAAGTYKITHKGSITYEFRLMDADKKSVPCTKIALKQRDDGEYEINFETAADTKGLTIGAPVDRTYVYDTLGVAYISIGDVIVINVKEEAAAAAK